MKKNHPMKIQQLNIFKDHHIVAKTNPIAVGYDGWLLSNPLWMKFYISHGKYRTELNECFSKYQCQLNFVMFCATSAIGISWQYFNYPNLTLTFLSMGNMKGYNNKILVSNKDMKIGSNKDINKDHKKLTVTPPEDDTPKMGKSNNKPIIDRIEVRSEKEGNQKMLAEKDNDKNLVITLLLAGARLIACYFWKWPKINGIIIIHNRWHCGECISL